MTTIKFKCPHCQKGLGVKEEFAGKKSNCPACKKPIEIPAVVAKPADMEEFAAAALADEPAKEEPKEAATFDFNCPMCDEKTKAPTDMQGKQMPCPECRRIIKVPFIVKKDPKDWRKVDHRVPSGAKQSNEPAPEGAWGTRDETRVSRQSLLEAQAIPEAIERLSRAEKIARTAKWTVTAAVLLLIAYVGYGYIQAGRQTKAFDQAALFVSEHKLKSPVAEAALQRALGEYLLRDGKAEEAMKQLQEARSKLDRDSSGSPEADFVLWDLALTQVDIGGDKPQVDAGQKLTWEKVVPQIRGTLGAIKSPEAQQGALRDVSRKLIQLGQPQAARTLVNNLSGAGAGGAEILAQYGIELLRAQQDAGAIANAALQTALAQVKQGEKDKTLPFTPSVIALLVATDKADKAAQLAPAPTEVTEFQPVLRIGYAEGLARKGDWNQAQKLALSPGAAQSRLMALEVLTAVAAETKQQDVARQNIDAAIKLVESELKGASYSPWILWRLARSAANAGLNEEVSRIAPLIADPAMRGRAQLEAVRARLADAQSVAKDSPASGLALEIVVRDKARQGNTKEAQALIDGWDSEPGRGFGYAGLALGMQDSIK